MNPCTLNEIWQKTKTINFRVRDVDTLQDYLITGIVSFLLHSPEHMTAYKCDEVFMGCYMLGCRIPKYILLSTIEESQWLEDMSTQQLVVMIKRAYQREV